MVANWFCPFSNGNNNHCDDKCIFYYCKKSEDVGKRDKCMLRSALIVYLNENKGEGVADD